MSNRRRPTQGHVSRVPEPGPGEAWATMAAVVSDRNDQAQIDEAMKETHDRLIAALGPRRRTGVRWTTHYAAEGRRAWKTLNEDLPEAYQDPEVLRRLEDPLSMLVVAWCIGQVPESGAIDREGRVFDPASNCPCCRTAGALDGQPFVTGEVASSCCDECLGALFLGGAHPHPLPGRSS